MGASPRVRLASLAEPILAGRSRELDELRLSLDSMKQGKGSTIFIAGEAGSGKTRLAREFLDIAKAQNVIVLSGWCLSNAAIPYFPFIEALESYTENEDSNLTSSSQLMSVKNRLSGSSTTGNISTGSLTPQTWKDQTYSLVTRELLGISTESSTDSFYRRSALGGFSVAFIAALFGTYQSFQRGY